MMAPYAPAGLIQCVEKAFLCPFLRALLLAIGQHPEAFKGAIPCTCELYYNTWPYLIIAVEKGTF